MSYKEQEKVSKVDLALYYARQLKSTMEMASKETPSRELSSAITRLQEAQFWLGEAATRQAAPLEMPRDENGR